MAKTPDFLKDCEIVPVGSTVTCNPPPTNTDKDFLVLVPGFEHFGIATRLCNEGWEPEGSHVTDEALPATTDQEFISFRKGRINLILTRSPVFFKRFKAATSVAKRLNLRSKPDRVALFQAVLYGNSCGEPKRHFGDV